MLELAVHNYIYIYLFDESGSCVGMIRLVPTSGDDVREPTIVSSLIEMTSGWERIVGVPNLVGTDDAPLFNRTYY